MLEYDSKSIEIKNIENYKQSVFNDIRYVLPNLVGDKYEVSEDKNLLIISLDILKHNEKLQFSLVKKNMEPKEIKICFLHVVNLPMDNDSGWIKKIVFNF